MNDKITTTTSNPGRPQKNKLSLSGWESYFDLGEDTIKVWGSICTGLERIYVNDQLTSEKRNWRFNSHHTFQLDGSELEVRIIVVSMLTGELRLELWRDGELIDSDDLSMKQAAAGTPLSFFQPKSFASWILLILAFAGAGALVGFLVGSLVSILTK